MRKKHQTMESPISQSRPVLTLTLSPSYEADRLNLQVDIDALVSTIPKTFPKIRILPGKLAGQILLGAINESELKLISTYLRAGSKISWDVGEPQVVYLETIRKSAEAEGKYVRQTGGSGNYGHCKIRLTPSEPGSGFTFVNELQPSEIPIEFLAPIQEGIREALECGVLHGHEIVDVTATLLAASHHSTDSNALAFRIAASMATRDAAKQAHPVVLQPMAEVITDAPEAYVGSILADLSRRRARIQRIDPGLRATEIRAIVPLAEAIGSHAGSGDSNPWTLGRVRFLRYEPVGHGSDPDTENTGIIAWTPDGPSPKHHSAAANLIFDEE